MNVASSEGTHPKGVPMTRSKASHSDECLICGKGFHTRHRVSRTRGESRVLSLLNKARELDDLMMVNRVENASELRYNRVCMNAYLNRRSKEANALGERSTRRHIFKN